MGSVLTVYKASAGSGKTFTLAVQYIKLLILSEDGGEYARILAVTFTNKATTEMKDRILSQLYGIGHTLKNSQAYYVELQKALKEEGRTDLTEMEIRQRCRMALHRILHDYNRFRVSTIDAFFQSVMRNLAHELGLTANLQVEISDSEVLSEAVDRLVDRLQDDQVLLEWMLSLVHDQIEENQNWNVTYTVKRFGRVIFDVDYLLRGDGLREVLHDEQRFARILCEIEQLRNEAVPATVALGCQLDEAVQHEGVEYEDFANGKNLRAFVKKLKAHDMTVVPSVQLRGWIENSDTMVTKGNQQKHPELLVSARNVSNVLGQVVEEYLRRQYDYNSAKLVLEHIKSLRLLGAIDEEVGHINAETSRFILAKTPILLHRMVDESDAPFVFEKMGALLRHVMIDEFQDTSSLQWMNFRALLLESYAKGGHNLIVGDVKQSIYRWRGGDWRVLGNIEDSFLPRPKIKTLDVNRRSLKRVIEFNNSFFLDAREVLDMNLAENEGKLDEPFSFTEAYADVKQEWPDDAPDAGYVRVKALDGNEFKRRDQWEPVVLEDLIAQIRMLHEAGLSYQQMAILVRTNGEAQPIVDAFARESDMPALVSDEAFSFASSPAIMAMITALRFIDDNTNEVAAFHLHQLGVTEICQDNTLRSLPLYELLETLYQRLQLDRIPHQEAYLFGFFDAVVDFIHNNVSDVHSFLRYWDDTLSNEKIPAGQVDGIRIITIHKAKGLEYHTVFIPFCAWDFDRKGELLWSQPAEAPYDELQLLPVNYSKGMSHSVFTKDFEQESLLSYLDELNSLYVAFTRACANLYIWYPKKKKKDNSMTTVADLLAAIVPDGYDAGEPVTEVEMQKQSDNRMTPDAQPENVVMCSYPFSAVFHQSNRSQMFLYSLDEVEDDEASSEQARQRQYIETGKLLHSVLQSIHTKSDLPHVLDALEQEGVISRHAPDGTYVSVRRSELQRWLEKGLRNSAVAEWFTGEWEIFNECSVVRRKPDSGLAETLRPDRVMLSKDGKRLVVVDFKFGHPSNEHICQVRTYMELLSAMYPSARVEGFLWYVYSGKVQPVDSSQLTLDF